MFRSPKVSAIRLLGLLLGVVLVAAFSCFSAAAQAPGTPKAELPLIITSSGQSPDALMIKLLCDQLKLKADFDKTLSADKLKGYRTIIIGIGGSMKGLGEAGIDTGDEIARVNQVIQRARQQKMLVVAMHTGGQPRRGDLADPFIHATAPKVDFLVVRNDGNKDGLFTKIAKENKIPIVYIEQVLEVKDVLKAMFGLK